MCNQGKHGIGRLLSWAAALLGAATLFGATPTLEWFWSNPTPHGNNIKDMAYSTNLALAIQVTEKGRIYVSSDLAAWSAVASGTSNALRSVTFGHSSGAYPHRAVVVGESGTVLYSDGGTNFVAGAITATDNWLEGVAAGPSQFIAVGDGGSVYASLNGVAWSKITVAFTNWLRSVAYGGGRFVAVGESGLVASYTGSSWQVQASGTSQHLNRVYYNNANFVVVGAAGVVLTNNGASAWGKAATGATNDLYAAAGGALTPRVVAGYGEVRLFDNSAWQSQLYPQYANGAPAWTYLSALTVGRVNNSFLLGGQAGMLVSGARTNSAYFWTQPNAAVRNYFFDLVNVGGLYTAVGTGAGIMTSVDGVKWSLELPPAGITNSVLLAVGGDTNLLVAVGDTGTLITSTNRMETWISTNISGTNITYTTNSASTLGVLWSAATNVPTTATLQGVAARPRAYLVVGDAGVLLASSNGVAWNMPASPTTNQLTGAAAWADGFAACGEKGTLLFSSNAMAWEVIAAITTNWLNRVRWLSGQLVAVGENGTILSSTNGRSWVKHSSWSSAWLHDVTQVGGYYFAVGGSGTVLASTNLTNWSSIGTISGKELFGAASDDGQLVVAGFEGVILRSQVAASTNPVAIVSFNAILSTNTMENLFIFQGQSAQQFTLESNDDLNPTNWYTDAHLAITETNGLLYYLQSLARSNAPASRYFRTRLAQ